MIQLMRVDHRLLHGQTAFTWSKAVGADCILIANDSVINDPIRKTAIQLSRPSGIKLVIKSVDDSIRSINSGVTDKYRLFIIVQNIADAKKIIDNCDRIRSLNIGGVTKRDGTTRLMHAVYCTDEEIQMIRDLLDRGIEVELRQVSSDTKIPAQKVI